MDRNNEAGHDVQFMGSLESDDCCGVGPSNYSPELSPRYAFEDHVPSVKKAEWARPPPHPRDFNRYPTSTYREDACIDSGVALSGPQADSREPLSFSTSSNSADTRIHSSSEERHLRCCDEELSRLDICNLRNSDEVGAISEPKEAKSDHGSEWKHDVDDFRINWDLIFEQDEDGDTQLHIAIMMERQVDFALSVINLCQNAELLDLQNDFHQTPLHLAIFRRQMQIVQALLSRGTSLFVCDRDGNTPLHLACQMGYTEAVNALTDRFRSHLEKTLLLKIIHHKNYEGLTCCHLSAMSQAPDNLFHLTEDCGADINIQEGKRGMTVLHMAAISNNENLVAFLLAQPNIELNELTYDGWTALDLATGRRLTSIQKLLSCAGAIKTEENVTTSSDSETSDLDDVETDDLIVGFQSLNMQ